MKLNRRDVRILIEEMLTENLLVEEIIPVAKDLFKYVKAEIPGFNTSVIKKYQEDLKSTELTAQQKNLIDKANKQEAFAKTEIGKMLERIRKVDKEFNQMPEADKKDLEAMTKRYNDAVGYLSSGYGKDRIKLKGIPKKTAKQVFIDMKDPRSGFADTLAGLERLVEIDKITFKKAFERRDKESLAILGKDSKGMRKIVKDIHYKRSRKAFQKNNAVDEFQGEIYKAADYLKDNVSGNKFRKYINDRRPMMAKQFNLSPNNNSLNGYYNSYVIKAWKGGAGSLYAMSQIGQDELKMFGKVLTTEEEGDPSAKKWLKYAKKSDNHKKIADLWKELARDDKSFKAYVEWYKTLVKDGTTGSPIDVDPVKKEDGMPKLRMGPAGKGKQLPADDVARILQRIKSNDYLVRKSMTVNESLSRGSLYRRRYRRY